MVCPPPRGGSDRHGGLAQLDQLAEALGVPHVGTVQQASTQPEPGNRLPGRQRLQSRASWPLSPAQLGPGEVGGGLTGVVGGGLVTGRQCATDAGDAR